MSPILAEIGMRKWEEEKVEGENKIIKFVRYVRRYLRSLERQ